jgi:glycosyltransferase involved in cell wall biosynthesis
MRVMTHDADDDGDGAPGFVVDRLDTPRRHLRVAVVTETWPPEVNGVALTLSRLVEGLRERDHTLQLIRPRQPADGSGAPPAGVDRLTAGVPIPRYPSMRMGLPDTRGLIRHWRLQRPDVVHIATEGPLGWSAVCAAERLQLPAVSDFRTNFHDYSRHYGVGWLRRPIVAYLRKFHNRTAFTTVPTQGLHDTLGGMGFRRLHVVPRGVDLQRFRPERRDHNLRHRWGADADTTVLLSVGRLAPEKNLNELLDAYRVARASGHRCRLVLVGDGPQRAELQARCPDAIFTGTVQGEALARHYASADLFVFTSQTETFGNVVTEAMASGLAVVAYRHAAAAEWLHAGISAWLAEVGDAIGFRQQLLQAIAQPQERVNRALTALAIARTLEWPRVVAQFESLLLEAAGSTATGLSRRASHHSTLVAAASARPSPNSTSGASTPPRSSAA